MKLSGLIIETSTVHSTKSARPLSIVKFVFLCDNDNNNKEAALTRMVATHERGRTRAKSAVFNCINQDVFQPKSSILGEISWRRKRRPPTSLDARARSTVDMHSNVFTATATVRIVPLLPIQLVNGFGLYLGVIHSPSGKMSYMEDP